MSEKTLLPEWAQSIKTYTAPTFAHSRTTQPYIDDIVLLLQALETEMRKVERAKEGLKALKNGELKFYDTFEHPNAFPKVEARLNGEPIQTWATQTLKELEE